MITQTLCDQVRVETAASKQLTNNSTVLWLTPTYFGAAPISGMAKTLAWLVEYVLKHQLERIRVGQGRFVLTSVMHILLARTCYVQHWFGIERAGNEQQLLAQLQAAKPTDGLPAVIQSGSPWHDENIQAAAAAMPGCAPLLYYLFQLFGDPSVLRWERRNIPGEKGESVPYKHQYQDLVTDPAEAVPNPTAARSATLVTLRKFVLGAKLLSLLPHRSKASGTQDLLCDFLIDAACKVMDHPECLEGSYGSSKLARCPEDSRSKEEQLCQLLVKILVPIIHEGYRGGPAHDPIRSGRANTACRVLIALLSHCRPALSARLADDMLAQGMCSP